MARAAGTSNHYTFKLEGVRRGEAFEQNFPAVTHILHSVKDQMGFGGMAWWGYKIGIQAALEVAGEELEEAYEEAKDSGLTPNTVRDSAAERGTGAHDLLEQLALETCVAYSENDTIKVVTEDPKILARILNVTPLDDWTDEVYAPVEHQLAAAKWWLDNEDKHGLIFPERPVWSVVWGYGGTTDFARELEFPGPDGLSVATPEYLRAEGVTNGLPPYLEVIDYKSHKPMAGARKDGTYGPGKGPAYVEDLMQEVAYGNAVEELGLGTVVAYRVVLLGAEGDYIEDTRQVPFETFLHVKWVHDQICRNEHCRRLAKAYGARATGIEYEQISKLLFEMGRRADVGPLG